jgi:hypothetical protein
VPLGPERCGQIAFQFETGVVGGERNTHAQVS